MLTFTNKEGMDSWAEKNTTEVKGFSAGDVPTLIPQVFSHTLFANFTTDTKIKAEQYWRQPLIIRYGLDQYIQMDMKREDLDQRPLIEYLYTYFVQMRTMRISPSELFADIVRIVSIYHDKEMSVDRFIDQSFAMLMGQPIERLIVGLKPYRFADRWNTEVTKRYVCLISVCDWLAASTETIDSMLEVKSEFD